MRAKAVDGNWISSSKEVGVQIPKDKIIELLKERGDQDRAPYAEQDLPDNVDHEEHADLLKKHRINHQDLLGKIGL